MDEDIPVNVERLAIKAPTIYDKEGSPTTVVDRERATKRFDVDGKTEKCERKVTR